MRKAGEEVLACRSCGLREAYYNYLCRECVDDADMPFTPDEQSPESPDRHWPWFRGAGVAIAAVALAGIAAVWIYSGRASTSGDSSTAVATVPELFDADSAVPSVAESWGTENEQDVIAEAAFIATLDEGGVGYATRRAAIDLGRSACDSLDVAVGRGNDVLTAKIALSAFYSSEGDMSMQNALAIVGAATGSFCPELRTGY
jgi:hypothetical protein